MSEKTADYKKLVNDLDKLKKKTAGKVGINFLKLMFFGYLFGRGLRDYSDSLFAYKMVDDVITATISLINVIEKKDI